MNRIQRRISILAVPVIVAAGGIGTFTGTNAAKVTPANVIEFLVMSALFAGILLSAWQGLLRLGRWIQVLLSEGDDQ
jgi:hypothetical protein